MNSEFLKSLIQLLAQHGGTFTCPLAELQPLGLELSLQNISSDNAATLTLRLGARIYYVPSPADTSGTRYNLLEKEEPCPTPSTPPAAPTTTSSTFHQPTGRTLPSAISPEDELAAVSNLNNRPRVKSDLDLYLLEQSATTKRTAHARQQAQELQNATREYPWENRKPS